MDIAIEQHSEEPWEFTVGLREEDENLGDYVVLMDEDDYHRYGAGVEPRELVAATFEFLLEREDPEMILERFQLRDVEKHFPEYPQEIRSYF